MSRRKGPRGLRPEEAELWDIIAARTRPMHPARRKKIDAEAETPPAKPAPARTAVEPIAPFRLGTAATAMPPAHDLASPLSDTLKTSPVRMDHKAHRKMTQGRLTPEARIDLHGMTLAAAHPALTRFIAQSFDRGLRLVLVITGKGKTREDDGPIPLRPGVLRHQVPQWLASGPLRPLVLQVAQAHQKHGGSGAYYVYLRRQR